MNDIIAIHIMSKLIGIEYVEKFGGVVQTIERTTLNARGESIAYRIPVAKAFHYFKDAEKDINENRIEVLNCGLKSAIMEDFLPESKISGMIYFEDNGVSVDTSKRHSGLNFFNSKLRLVGWFNQKKFREIFDNDFRSKAMIEIMNKILTKRPIKQGNLSQMMVRISSIPPLDSGIFSSYDFNESQTQFLTAPYDFFAIDLDISFAIPKNCSEIKFIPEEVIC